MVPSAVLSRTKPLRSTAANSFRFRSYANRPILHFFGANKSFRFRSYRHPAPNPFRIRSYTITGGWCPLLSPDLHGSQATSHGPLPSGKKPWDRPPDLHNFGAPITTFRINTSISVASKRLYLPLESTLMKKGGEGEGAPAFVSSMQTPTERGVSLYCAWQGFSLHCESRPRLICYA